MSLLSRIEGSAAMWMAGNDQLIPAHEFIAFAPDELEQSLPDRFEQTVSRQPSRLAIKEGVRELTYDCLNRAANRLAHAILAKRGDAPEPVVLMLEHGTPAIVGVLGALKAGKLYVPLDPLCPAARVSYIFQDAKARLVIGAGRSDPCSREAGVQGDAMIWLDDLGDAAPEDNPVLVLSPDRLAAIFYTSGSTGQPKGVAFSHRNLLHCAKQHINTCHVSCADRTTLLFPYMFSWSTSDIFGVLLSGGSLFPYNVARHGTASLGCLIEEEQITIAQCAATVFRNFAEALPADKRLPHLRLLSIGGEPIRRRDVELFRAHFSPQCLLKLGFGMTEAAGCATAIYLGPTTPLDGEIMPAGYPTDDLELTLQDSDGGVVPRGQVGEIVLRSRYLSQGYWGRPELNSQRFGGDPAGDGVRILRTGDLGRMGPDGCLYHLGRGDSQLKVRGQRVEAQEVERRLCETDGVANAAVTVRPDASGENRLVAYVVAQGSPAPTVSRLRRELSVSLPEHMVPSAFVFLDKLPLMPSGKVDRQTLPELGMSRPALDTPLIAPRTPIEEVIAGLWSQVLGVSPIGVQDSFFDLGGHSLAVTRLASRLLERFDVELPFKTLFAGPTVEKQALAMIEAIAGATLAEVGDGIFRGLVDSPGKDQASDPAEQPTRRASDS